MPSIVCPNPSCSCRIAMPDDSLGRIVRCPRCQTRFTSAGSTAGKASATVDPLAKGAGDGAPSGTEKPKSLGRFIVRQRLGMGAFGSVYRAYDPQLDREVALKLPHRGTLDSPLRVERVRREAKAAANLRHPHIVPVYESGQVGDRYYIASAFIPGTTLAEALGETGGPLVWQRAAGLVRALAEALAYAHEQGVVHRDVKPANVMLDGKGQPLLMDFGLASRKDEASKLTNDGAVMGTPAYMAPEQAAGKSGEAKPAADQYSLGCVLYELLTGATPFSGPPEVQIFNHLRKDPPDPRRLNPNLPADLAAICLKCLEKEPGRRYPECRALAEDLRHCLAGETTEARPLGPVQRGVRWARRNPTIAGLVAALILALTSGLIASTLFALDASSNAKRADMKAIEARREAKAAREREYDANMLLAQSAWEQNWVFGLNEVLARQKPQAGQDDLRGFEWYFWKKQLRQGQRTLNGHTSLWVYDVAYSPDGKRLASVGVDGEVKVWDLATGRVALTLKGLRKSGLAVAYSPDGKYLAAGGGHKPGQVKIWDAAIGHDVLTMEAHAATVSGVAFSPDGKRLASADADGAVKVWDAATGQGILTIRARGSHQFIELHDVAYSPDGKRLATVTNDHTVKVWDAATGKEMLSLEAPSLPPTHGVSFSSDGKHLAWVGAERIIKVFDLVARHETLTLAGHTDHVWCMAFSPDGKRLASGSSDRTVKVWDMATGEEILTLRGHTGEVYGVAWSPDGKHVVSCGGAKGAPERAEVKVWDVVRGQEPLILRHEGFVNAVAYSPKGKRLASAGRDGTVKVWDVVKGQELRVLKGDMGELWAVAFSPDGKFLTVMSQDGTVKVWDPSTGREVFSMKGDARDLLGGHGVAYSSDGKRLAACDGGRLKVWDVGGRKEVLSVKGFCVAFSPDGKHVATFAVASPPSAKPVHMDDDPEKVAARLHPKPEAAEVKVWDVDTGQEALTLQGHTDRPSCIAYSPNGQLLATGGADRTVKVWDLVTGREVFARRHTNDVLGVVFTPDGKRLASADQDGMVKLLNVATGEEVLSLKWQRGEDMAIWPGVWHLAFSPDGRHLATARFGSVNVWDADADE